MLSINLKCYQNYFPEVFIILSESNHLRGSFYLNTLKFNMQDLVSKRLNFEIRDHLFSL